RQAGDARLDGWRDPPLDLAFHHLEHLFDALIATMADPDDDPGDAGMRSQAPDRRAARRPRRDDDRLRQVVDRRTQRPSLALHRAGRAAQRDDHAFVAAELAEGDLVGELGFGPVDQERVRPQFARETAPEEGKGEGKGSPNAEREARASYQ